PPPEASSFTQRDGNRTQKAQSRAQKAQKCRIRGPFCAFCVRLVPFVFRSFLVGQSLQLQRSRQTSLPARPIRIMSARFELECLRDRARKSRSRGSLR